MTLSSLHSALCYMYLAFFHLGQNKQTTPTETRRKAPRKCGRKLGILERAAREFEDSQVVNTIKISIYKVKG